MTVLLAALAGGVGALVRGEVVSRLGVRRGTAVVNLVGAALLGLLTGLAGGYGAATSTLLVLGAGGMGGMTTFSTWMLDTTGRDREDQPVAVVVTLLVGVGLAGVGWFLGALVA